MSNATAARAPDRSAVERRSIGVIGLGLLGRGIVACLLAHGFRVIALTRRHARFAAARQHVKEAIADLASHGVVPVSAADGWPQRYVEAESIAALSDCDFVIESITEDLEAKQTLFDQVEAAVASDVPIASNTSALPISQLQAPRMRPQRFVGMHWAEPCHLTRFLEIVRGEQTDDATIDATIALAHAARKDPSLVRKDVEGFIVNRLGYAMYREAFHLLESGVADAETIDRSFRNAAGLWAAIAGPFRWMDLTGLPAYAAVMQRLLPKLSNAAEVPLTLTNLIEQGAVGVSAGRGFYEYSPEEAQRWHEMLREHVWSVRRMHDRYFPIPQRSEPKKVD